MRKALLTAFVSMMLVLTIGSALCLWQLLRQRDIAEHLSADLHQVLSMERELTKHLNRVQIEVCMLMHGYRRDADAIIASVAGAEAVIREHSQHHAIGLPGQTHAQLQSRLAGMKDMISRAATADDYRLRTQLAGDCMSQNVVLRRDTGELREGVADHVRQQLAASSHAAQNMTIVFVAVFWVMVALFLLVMHRTFSFLSQGVSSLVAGAERIARGEFGHRVEVRGGAELQELARAMNTMANDLGQAEENRAAAVRQLVVSLNHEFNNRVSVVLGVADWLKRRRGKDDPELSERLDEIRTSASEISALLRRLTHLQRVATTEYMPGVEMLDIAGSPGGSDDREEEAGQDDPAGADEQGPPAEPPR